MRGAAIVAAALLAGCTLLPPPTRQPPTRQPPAAGEAGTGQAAASHSGDLLLASLARMMAMDETTLAAEITRTREVADLTSDPYLRVEAALAASLSTTPDDAQVLALLAPVLAAYPPVEGDLRAMAGFLQALAIDRRKLRDELTATVAKSRDDRREAQSQRLRADAQQERADRLQQTLEALTNLEKSLSNRKHAEPLENRPR